MDMKIVPYGDPMPEGWKPLVTLQMPDGRTTTSRAEAESNPPAPAEEIARHIRVNTSRGLPTLETVHGMGPELGMLPPNNRCMALACYGPSLVDTWQCLLDVPPHVDIWTTSGAYNFLADRGIVPDCHTDVDPREYKATIIRKWYPQTRFYIPSRAHPLFFDRLEGANIVLYHIDVKQEREVVWACDPNAGMVPPAISAGLCALRMGLALGYRNFVILGMDGSYRPTEGVPAMHASDHPNPGEGFSLVAVKHPRTGEEKEFITNMLHLLAVDDFFVIAQPYPVGTFRFVGDGLIPWAEQCAREGTVYGDCNTV